MLSRRGSGCPITIVRTAALGATSSCKRISAKHQYPCFADLHHRQPFADDQGVDSAPLHLLVGVTHFVIDTSPFSSWAHYASLKSLG